MRSDVSVPELRSWLYRVAQTTLADHWREYYAGDARELDEDVARPPAPRENPEAVQRGGSFLPPPPENYRRGLGLPFLLGSLVPGTATGVNPRETTVTSFPFW